VGSSRCQQATGRLTRQQLHSRRVMHVIYANSVAYCMSGGRPAAGHFLHAEYNRSLVRRRRPQSLPRYSSIAARLSLRPPSAAKHARYVGGRLRISCDPRQTRARSSDATAPCSHCENMSCASVWKLEYAPTNR